jgi:signal transduction histidine kinase
MARNRYELQLDVEDGFPLTLSEKASQELTRIIQEALTNARRHSEARRVEVRLWLAGDLACAEVADDGRGFDAAQAGIGVGQHSMRHRALELGGGSAGTERARPGDARALLRPPLPPDRGIVAGCTWLSSSSFELDKISTFA